MLMRFFGIDLAFSEGNPSGIYTLDEKGAHVASSYLFRDEEIVGYFAEHRSPEGNVILVDAPLCMPNETGQRTCENLIGKSYGRNHASCHSSNMSNRAGQRGPKFVMPLQYQP
jgi:predicted RNase H-like nuclease